MTHRKLDFALFEEELFHVHFGVLGEVWITLVVKFSQKLFVAAISFSNAGPVTNVS